MNKIIAIRPDFDTKRNRSTLWFETADELVAAAAKFPGKTLGLQFDPAATRAILVRRISRRPPGHHHQTGTCPPLRQFCEHLDCGAALGSWFNELLQWWIGPTQGLEEAAA